MPIIIYKLKFIFIMRIFQSVFLNDTHDHDTRDTEADFVLVKSEE